MRGLPRWPSACASRAAGWPNRRTAMALPRRTSHERRDPDHRRSRPTDRRKAALPGRADPGLPRPRACARRRTELVCSLDRGARVRRCARRRACDHGRWPSGLLHGIPIGLKDIVDTKGIPTTCGSKFLQDNIPDTDAACAEKLAAAGTVLMGKLTTHEFADGGPSLISPLRPRATLGTPSISPPAAAAAPVRRSRRG